jgi:hypothetical protein
MYSKATSYDSNRDGCLRLNHAYGVLMNQTTTWTKGHNNFTFSACSGAQYANIAEDKNASQIAKSGPNPRFITLTIGGNNIGFFNIAVNCIYQQDLRHNYGAPYENDPGRTGDCAQAIDVARSRIPQAMGWIKDTMQDVMSQENTRPNPTFDIFLSGYVHFFNADQDSQCNGWSFGAIPLVHQPKLSYPLRRDLNDLVQQLNDQYRRGVDALNSNWWLHPSKSRAHFVDISPGFNAHRFCEPQHTWRNQYYSDDVWVWNLSPDTPSGQEADYPDIPSAANSAFQGMIEAQGLFNIAWDKSGIMFRPFHPKKNGHNSIKDAMLAAIKDAKIAGTVWE